MKSKKQITEFIDEWSIAKQDVSWMLGIHRTSISKLLSKEKPSDRFPLKGTLAHSVYSLMSGVEPTEERVETLCGLLKLAASDHSLSDTVKMGLINRFYKWSFEDLKKKSINMSPIDN